MFIAENGVDDRPVEADAVIVGHHDGGNAHVDHEAGNDSLRSRVGQLERQLPFGLEGSWRQ